MVKNVVSYLLIFLLSSFYVCAQTNHEIVTATGVYSFNYNQVPDGIISVGTPPAGFNFQWEKSAEPVNGFTSINGATGASYYSTTPLTETNYFRRRSTQGSTTIYSNTIQLSLVSVN